MQTPRDRAYDERRQVRNSLNSPFLRNVHEIGPNLSDSEQNSVPYTTSPAGHHVSAIRQDVQSGHAKANADTVAHAKHTISKGKSKRRRPLKDI